MLKIVLPIFLLFNLYAKESSCSANILKIFNNNLYLKNAQKCEQIVSNKSRNIEIAGNRFISHYMATLYDKEGRTKYLVLILTQKKNSYFATILSSDWIYFENRYYIDLNKVKNAKIESSYKFSIYIDSISNNKNGNLGLSKRYKRVYFDKKSRYSCETILEDEYRYSLKENTIKLFKKGIFLKKICKKVY